MGHRIIKASEIARFIGAYLIGDDVEVYEVAPAGNVKAGCLSFISKEDFCENTQVKLLYLIPLKKTLRDENHQCSYIKVKNPRLAFAKIVQEFFVQKPEAKIAKTAKIGSNVTLGKNVTIGEYCVIGDNVIIGDESILNHHITIYDNSNIGSHCYIKSGAVIGEEGFGFDFEEDRTPIRVPHLGKVVVEDYVEIGANSVIARGTLENTIIKEHVKIDDAVFIAHNCFIGKNSLIIANAEISGSVKIGENCWIGPHVSIIQKVRIGNRVKLGIGAVVVYDIEDGKTIMGLEGLPLKRLLKLKKGIGYGS